MSKRKKRKTVAIATFGLGGVADRYEAEPLYQRKFHESDMEWLADEYRRRSNSEPSLTLEDFSAQYGVSADELRAYIPELGEGINRSVILWHGTSKSRAQSILKEGFRPQRGKIKRMFFTRDRVVARDYAKRRANLEKDQPVVIMCSMDLNQYDDYERQGQGVFAFRAECISSEVVKRVAGVSKRQHEKREKCKDASKGTACRAATDIALTFNSGRAGIAYWINSYLKLDDPHKVCEEDEAVGKIEEWLDAQASEGRFSAVPDDEMLEQVRKYLP